MPSVTTILGIDESGRGPLAGPVVAAGVVLDHRHPIGGLNDSKKLSEPKREALYELIMRHARLVTIAHIDHFVIDTINILQATLRAMRDVIVKALAMLPIDLVMIDGNQTVPGVHVPQQAIVQGDNQIECIMAASIVAKVHRDRLMKDYHKQFPGYDFIKNKGYGTKAHLVALEKLGPSVIHRRSFAPIKEQWPADRNP